MTLADTPRLAGPYSGNGSTTIFPFTFRVFESSDLRVTRTTAGLTTTLVLNTDYSVALNPDQIAAPGGSVTPTVLLAVGQTLNIAGALPYDQTLDLPDGGAFSAGAQENAFDRTVMQIQQLRDQVDTLPIDATLSTRLADASNALNGAGMVAYNNALTYAAGSVGSAIAAALSAGGVFADVTAAPYNAVGDGISNDTAEVQAALDSGLPVWFPPGTYLCDTLTIQANAMLLGAGPGLSIIKQNTTTGASYGTLYCDSGHISNTKDNITIRDLKFLGQVATQAFSEFEHLVSLSGVRNVLIDNVHFVGYRGDGLLIGCSPTALQERHNYNVRVRNCFFDGVNNDNRNGISVIDVDGMEIAGCYFTRSTRSNMPGAIDFEPDNLAAYVIRNINVHDNTFVDCGGNTATIGLFVLQPNYTIPQNAIIRHNTFKGRVAAKTGADIGIAVVRNWVTTDITMNVLIEGNVGRNGLKGIELYGCNGVVVRGNSLSDYTAFSINGYVTAATQRACNVSWEGNVFNRCGSTTLVALYIAETTYADFINNTFVDSGSGAAGSEHIDFTGTATSNNVRMIGNRYSSPAGLTLIAIQKEVAHTFTPLGNVELQEKLGGLSSFFVAHDSDRIVPTWRGRLVTTMTIATGTVTTTLIYDAEDEDNYAAHNPATGVFTVPVAGVYQVQASAICDYLVPSSAGVTGGSCRLNVFRNGVRRISGNEVNNGDPSNAVVTTTIVSGLVSCDVGDTLTIVLMTFNNPTVLNDVSGGASGYGTLAFIRRIGPK